MMDMLSAHAGTIGLLFFFTFFISMLAWVFRPGSKKRYENYANIPLKEGGDD